MIKHELQVNGTLDINLHQGVMGSLGVNDTVVDQLPEMNHNNHHNHHNNHHNHHNHIQQNNVTGMVNNVTSAAVYASTNAATPAASPSWVH